MIHSTHEINVVVPSLSDVPGDSRDPGNLKAEILDVPYDISKGTLKHHLTAHFQAQYFPCQLVDVKYTSMP